MHRRNAMKENCPSHALDLGLIKSAIGRHHNTYTDRWCSNRSNRHGFRSSRNHERAELKDYRTRHALLIAQCQPPSNDQGVNASLIDVSLQRLVTPNLAWDATTANNVITVYRLVGLITHFIKLLKPSCRDHKIFSLHLGLHIGYRLYLLTYVFDQLHISYRNEHSYLFIYCCY